MAPIASRRSASCTTRTQASASLAEPPGEEPSSLGSSFLNPTFATMSTASRRSGSYAWRSRNAGRRARPARGRRCTSGRGRCAGAQRAPPPSGGGTLSAARPAHSLAHAVDVPPVVRAVHRGGLADERFRRGDDRVEEWVDDGGRPAGERAIGARDRGRARGARGRAERRVGTEEDARESSRANARRRARCARDVLAASVRRSREEPRASSRGCQL